MPQLSALNVPPWAWLALGIMLLAGGYAVMPPRGIRNNNWLNIRWSARNDWRGQTGQDLQGFAQFSGPEWGIRAAAKLLRSDIYAGKNTVRQLVNEWAPAIENNTAAYVDHVAQSIGVHPDQAVTVAALPGLLHTMARHEVGAGKLPDNASEIIGEGLRLLEAYSA